MPGAGVDELSFIDPGPVRAMREREEEAAARLREEIARLQEQLAVREARIAVLDEVLTRCQVEIAPLLPPPVALPGLAPPAPIAAGYTAEEEEDMQQKQRATAASMGERCQAVISVLEREGDMTPRDLLPLVNAELGEELLPHQLRAVLRKYTDIFESRPDKHGIWGLVRQR